MRWRRVLRWAAGALGVGALIVAVSVVVLTRTHFGAGLALRVGLSQVHGRFDGRFAVSDIRTGDLLREVALYDVTVVDLDGRPALAVDSLRLAYRVGDLLRGLVHIRDADVWGARVTIVQMAGEDRVNVERIFDPIREGLDPDGEEGGGDLEAGGPVEGGGPRVKVRLSSTRIHGAHLSVRTPAGPEPDTASGVFEPTADGEWLRRIEVVALDVEVVNADLVGPELDGERAQVSDLSAEVRLFPTPMAVEHLTGELRRVGSEARVEATRLQIASSRFQGSGAVDWGGDGLDFEADLTSDGFDPADFAFFEPRLPSGVGRGTIRASSGGGQAVYTLADAELAVDGSLVTGSVTVHTGDSLRLEAVDLTVDPLEMALLEPWMDAPLPSHLALRGRMTADGPLDRLELAGRLTVEAVDRRHGASTVELSGAISATAPLAAYNLSARADPLDFALVRELWAPFPIEGRGTLRGTATGRLDRGMDLDATLTHTLTSTAASRVRYDGSIARAGSTAPALDGRAELLGLHLPTLAGVHPMFEADEVAFGSIDLEGPVDDLLAHVDLQSSFGDVTGSIRMDATDPGAGARLDAELADLDPGPLMNLDADVSLTGRLQADLARDRDGQLGGTAEVSLLSSRYDRWVVDSLWAPVSVEDGYATLTSAGGMVAGVRLDASGTVALDSVRAPGSLDVGVSASSLAQLWDVLAETAADSAADSTESSAPPEILDGRARGQIQLRAALPRLDLSGHLEVLEAAHELLDVDSARFEIRGTDVISENRSLVVDGVMGPSRVLGGAFDTAGVTLAYEADSVSFSFSLARADSVRHDVMGALRLGEEQTDLRLDRVELRRGDELVALARPANLSWGTRGVSVEGFEMVEPSRADRSLSASGTIPTEGPIDFRAQASGFQLAALSALWKRDDSVSGVVEGQIHLRGPVEDPSLTGELLIRDVAYRSTIADLLRADLAYEDGVASVRIDASREGATLLDGAVRVPVNLSPTYDGPRVMDAPLDGRITARSFPLAPLLSSQGFMEDVAGTVAGDVVLGGTPRTPQLSGRMEVEGVSALFPDFGVRQEARGTLTLDEGSIDVDLSVRSVGRSRITGTVGLEDVGDPSFDLRIRADTFQVLNRRDVSGQVSGDATFSGSWASPRLEGVLAIQNADLRLDELARSRQVDDVSRRDFYQVVDTTIFIDQRLTTPSFADRSTISLDLTLGGGTWLRGRTLDTDLAGRLRVTHEPGTGYGVSGELQTVRGSYRGFGRTFQVLEGSVLFAGSESLNPVLNITTVTRIRSSEQALDIFATLEGTAEEPRVTLTSAAEPPMAEEELVSYLVFGRPSYQLGSGENAVVSGVTGAASSMALGLVANELGSALGQQIGVFDYFTISAPQEAAAYGQESALRSSISATEVEFGQYLSENLFLAAIFRPLDTANSFAGGRLEWRFRDSATLELFLEDRLARSPSATFGDLGFTLEQSLGMFLAKEWTY